MGIYVWGTGCGASELIEAGLEPARIIAKFTKPQFTKRK